MVVITAFKIKECESRCPTRRGGSKTLNQDVPPARSAEAFGPQLGLELIYAQRGDVDFSALLHRHDLTAEIPIVWLKVEALLQPLDCTAKSK